MDEFERERKKKQYFNNDRMNKKKKYKQTNTNKQTKEDIVSNYVCVENGSGKLE